MKRIYFPVLIFVLFSVQSFSQVIVTPYAVLIDNKNKFGTYSVINEASDPTEVIISFKFEYLKSDSSGNLSFDTTSANMNNITNWIKAFPKKFILKPNEKQTVRMTVSPPAGLSKGTYWTKIITSSQKQQKMQDTSAGITAKINFVFNQITTVLYKNERYENKADLKDVRAIVDSQNVNLISSVSITGDQPFYAQFDYKIFDSGNSIVYENTEYIGLYFDINKKYLIPVSDIKPGSYTAQITLSSDTGTDIPKTDKGPIQPVTKKVDFIIQ